MKFIVCDSYEEMSRRGAEIIADVMKAKPRCLLGLATGSTPVGMYRELIAMCRRGEIDFSEVVTYNLDEYYPISPDNDQSYRYFMNKNLFDEVNIDKANTHVPDGAAADADAACRAYDEAYAKTGGADVQVLGIGQNGHIAFNEPEEALTVGTHVTSLTEDTIRANSRFFASVDEVPTRALTMGMGSIMMAKSIILLANGKNKHAAVELLKGDKITPHCPATLLKLHPDVTVLCDKEAFLG
jgi:glucosamine-6-phosphate deaminase